jgi:hypothetical protein
MKIIYEPVKIVEEYKMESKNDVPDLPGSAADEMETSEQEVKIPVDAAYIHNIMFNKEWLTRQEAIMLINSLSGSVLIDETRRGKSQKEDKKYL